MLSRTAENLYWIGRYMERAETMARLLEVGERISLMPNTVAGYRSDWDSILRASGTAEGFARKYNAPIQRNLESYLFFDRANTSSVASCIERARENARVVRTALTTQVWEAINTAFQELRQMEREERSAMPLSRMTDWTTRQTALVRGSIEGTQLRKDGYYFLNLGYHLERADNTARLLDVKYFMLLPQADYVGSGLDSAQWSTLLRSLSAHRAFNWAYGGDLRAEKVADFLILNPACPRSLMYCIESASSDLEAIARAYANRTEAQSRVRRVVAELIDAQVSDIFNEGMHEFLNRMIEEVAGISASVTESYLIGGAR